MLGKNVYGKYVGDYDLSHFLKPGGTALLCCVGTYDNEIAHERLAEVSFWKYSVLI